MHVIFSRRIMISFNYVAYIPADYYQMIDQGVANAFKAV